MTKKLSLSQYLEVNRISKCNLCKLPAPVMKQLLGRRQRSNGGPTVDEILSWLKSLGYKVTHAEFLSHVRAGHERLLRQYKTTRLG